MKKRRTLVISLLLVAAIALGVGYAAVQAELTISGKAIGEQRADALKINFIASEVKDATTVEGLGIETTHSYTSNGGSFSIDGISTGESVTFTYTVKNEETDERVGAKLRAMPAATYKIYQGTGVAAENEVDPDHYADYFTVNTVIKDSDNTAWDVANDLLMPGETATVTITVTMTAEAVDVFTLNDYNFTMIWDAELVNHPGVE